MSKLNKIDAAIRDYYQKKNLPVSSDLITAILYSVDSGGKRIRPLIFLDLLEGFGLELTPSHFDVAASLEMIHTGSLIHDDLPAMDNDDYRRGRLTNHKVFGQAMAVLAGDGLLTQAFEVMTEQKGVDPALMVEIIHLIARCAGPEGMVGGQALDINAEEKHLEPAEMKQLHEAKTGALFIAAIRSGALLGGGSKDEVNALTKFATFFGLAFQITDDILDVEGDSKIIGKMAGMDEKMHKSTYVSLFTLEGAKAMALDTLKKAELTLEPFGERAEPLLAIARHLYNRKK